MAAIAAAVLFIPSAFAVHNTGAFELDGNATNGAVAGDDWDNVCHQVNSTACPTGSNTNGAVAVSWLAEPNLNSTIFTGGGSKDPQDINNWAWKDGAGGLPDKDNLLHAFAAQYSLDSTAASGTCPNGTDPYDSTVKCDVLYFGSDRYDNSGDAQQGFWFFQNKIGLGNNAVGGGSGFTSSGSGQTPASWHRDGDVLVISDFSNGGGTSTITVYKWDHTCAKGVNNPQPGQCGDANLRLLSTSTNAKCASTLADNDNACGIVNPQTIQMPWSFTDKSKTANNGALNGEFFEAGINLSTLGLSTECFASVMAETRSSTSTTATLKDFVLGGFGACGASLDTTPTADAAIGDDGTATVSDSATLTVSGLSSPPAPTGTAEFYLCGPSDGIQSCDDSGTDEGAVDWNTATKVGNTYTINSGDITVTSAGDYCFFVTWAGDSNYPDGASHDSANECFTIAPRSPVLTTSATAGPVSPGDEISDTATFTTSPAGPSNGTFGTITFNAYGPDDSDCSDTPAYTSTITINGTDTSYNSADGDGGAFTDTHPGTYLWVAEYDPAAGDNNNVSASTSCGDEGESSEVQQLQPNMDTAQNFVPNDSATITVDSGAGDLAGNVVFYMWVNDSTCGGGDLTTADYTSDSIDVTTGTGTGTSRTVTSDNQTAYDTDGTTFSWVVTYTSTNNGHHDVTSACGNETSSITIDNGSTSSS